MKDDHKVLHERFKIGENDSGKFTETKSKKNVSDRARTVKNY